MVTQRLVLIQLVLLRILGNNFFHQMINLSSIRSWLEIMLATEFPRNNLPDMKWRSINYYLEESFVTSRDLAEVLAAGEAKLTGRVVVDLRASVVRVAVDTGVAPPGCRRRRRDEPGGDE